MCFDEVCLEVVCLDVVCLEKLCLESECDLPNPNPCDPCDDALPPTPGIYVVGFEPEPVPVPVPVPVPEPVALWVPGYLEVPEVRENTGFFFLRRSKSARQSANKSSASRMARTMSRAKAQTGRLAILLTLSSTTFLGCGGGE